MGPEFELRIIETVASQGRRISLLSIASPDSMDVATPACRVIEVLNTIEDIATALVIPSLEASNLQM
jgi:hypothetical protein